MKKMISIVLFTLITIGLNAQEACTKFYISGFIVELKPAKTFSYEYDKSNSVELKVKGNELHIKSQEKEEQSWFSKVANGEQQRRLTLVVYTPNVELLELKNSDVNCTVPLNNNKLQISAAGSTQFIADNVDVNNLFLNISSSSNISLTGAAKDMQADISSSGKLTLVQFKVENQASFNMSSSASANMSLDADKVKANLSSSANLQLDTNTAMLEIKVSSAAKGKLTGKVKQLIAEASSAGKVDAKSLTVTEASVKTSSAGSVQLNAAKMVQSESNSGSTIENVYGQ